MQKEKLTQTKKNTSVSRSASQTVCALRNDRGFTLVEVLISLAIFSIAITGVITVAAQGGITANSVKNRVAATYLADEGIELVRGLRDTMILGSGSAPTATSNVIWETEFANSASNIFTKCNPSHGCDIDLRNVAATTDPFPTLSNILNCAVGVPCPLYYDNIPTDQYYGYYINNNLAGSGGPLTPSPFSRVITIVAQAPTSPYAGEVRVTSTVTWKEGSNVRTVTQSESLFDWY